jgi:hypothetical protein
MGDVVSYFHFCYLYSNILLMQPISGHGRGTLALCHFILAISQLDTAPPLELHDQLCNFSISSGKAKI